MEFNHSGLEELLQRKSSGKHFWQPWNSEYDIHKHAGELLKESRMRALKVDEEEAAYFLAKAYQQNAELYSLAVHSDSVDKYRGLMRKAITAGVSAALAPFTVGGSAIVGGVVYFALEAYQWRTKWQVMKLLKQSKVEENRSFGTHLRNHELLTLVPMLGDVMDFFNTYIKYTERAITNEGRRMIFDKYAADIHRKYEAYESPFDKERTTSSINKEKIIDGEFIDLDGNGYPK